VVIGVAVVVTTVVVVRRHAGPLVAAVAGLVVSVYPPLVANDTVTLTEGLSLLLVILLMDAVLRRRALLAGALCGVLVLTRPSAQLLIVLVAGWFLWKVGWRRAAASVAVAALVILPWVVRNEVVMGAPVIVTTNGFNLAAMYSKQAQTTGNFVDPLNDHYFDDMRIEQFDEAGWDAKLRERAVRDLSENPAQVLSVLRRNTGALLELTPRVNGIAEVIDGRNITIRNWTLPTFYLASIAGVVGLWRWRRHPLGLLAALVAAYFLLSSLVLVAAPRLRAPADFMICIGVGLLVAGRPSTDPDPGEDEDDSDVAGEGERLIGVLDEAPDVEPARPG
jgi:hypothetical protein